MTSEQQSLLKNITFWTKDNLHEQNILIEELDRFFESNVIIPKGSNRHPYADVLHEWLEGAQTEYKNTIGRIDGWNKLSFQLSEYRIKPSEPVYEWQWYYINEEGYAEIDETGFNTENEICMNPIRYKIEETKRERKMKNVLNIKSPEPQTCICPSSKGI